MILILLLYLYFHCYCVALHLCCSWCLLCIVSTVLIWTRFVIIDIQVCVRVVQRNFSGYNVVWLCPCLKTPLLFITNCQYPLPIVIICFLNFIAQPCFKLIKEQMTSGLPGKKSFIINKKCIFKSSYF